MFLAEIYKIGLKVQVYSLKNESFVFFHDNYPQQNYYIFYNMSLATIFLEYLILGVF